MGKFYKDANEYLRGCEKALDDSTALNDKERIRHLCEKLFLVIEQLTYYLVYSKGHYPSGEHVEILNEIFTELTEVDFYSKNWRKFSNPRKKEPINERQRDFLNKLTHLYGVKGREFWKMKESFQTNSLLRCEIKGYPFFGTGVCVGLFNGDDLKKIVDVENALRYMSDMSVKDSSKLLHDNVGKCMLEKCFDEGHARVMAKLCRLIVEQIAKNQCA